MLVNPITGELIKNDNEKGKIFYFLKGTEPYLDNSYDWDAVFKDEDNEQQENNDMNNNDNRDSNNGTSNDNGSNDG